MSRSRRSRDAEQLPTSRVADMLPASGGSIRPSADRPRARSPGGPLEPRRDRVPRRPPRDTLAPVARPEHSDVATFTSLIDILDDAVRRRGDLPSLAIRTDDDAAT